MTKDPVAAPIVGTMKMENLMDLISTRSQKPAVIAYSTMHRVGPHEIGRGGNQVPRRMLHLESRGWVLI
jgi:hypothetical protein